jgi:hypothetical protein
MFETKESSVSASKKQERSHKDTTDNKEGVDRTAPSRIILEGIAAARLQERCNAQVRSAES